MIYFIIIILVLFIILEPRIDKSKDGIFLWYNNPFKNERLYIKLK